MDSLEDRAPGEASGRAGGGGRRYPSPPRGALDGIRKDHERAKAARASGETLKAGAAWSNGAAAEGGMRRARNPRAGSDAPCGDQKFLITLRPGDGAFGNAHDFPTR